MPRERARDGRGPARRPRPGADAFRWFFYASSPPWSATRHSLSNVRALQKEFAVKLRNVYSFFTIYANIDGFDPRRRAPARGADARARSLDPERARAHRARRDRAHGRATTSTARRSGSSRSSTRCRTGGCAGAARASGERAGTTTSGARTRRSTRALVTLAKLIAPFTPYARRGDVPEPRRRARAWPARARACTSRTGRGRRPVARSTQTLSTKIATVRELVSLGLQVRDAGEAQGAAAAPRGARRDRRDLARELDRVRRGAARRGAQRPRDALRPDRQRRRSTSSSG